MWSWFFETNSILKVKKFPLTWAWTMNYDVLEGVGAPSPSQMSAVARSRGGFSQMSLHLRLVQARGPPQCDAFQGLL